MPDLFLPRTLTETARSQFASTFRMLRTFVEICPDGVWASCYFGFPYPVWYQAYHAAYFVDYWMQDTYEGPPALCKTFDPRIPPEFEHGLEPGVFVERAELLHYLGLLAPRIGRWFDRLHDGMLGETTRYGQTYADVLFAQNRHVMYNVGYLNAVLRSLGLEEADWYAYNEAEE